MKYRIETILLITTLICGVLPLINLPTTVKASPITLHVPADYSTITAAIGAANPGDTILVDPGTYYEAVDINTQLNITSTGGPSVTFIDGTGLGALPSAGLVKITAAGDVTFSGFTVQQAPADTSGVTFGILSQSSVAGVTYTISHNNVYGTNDPDNANDYGFYSQSDSANVVFTHNLITQTGANNIVFELHTGATEISHNILDSGVYGSDATFFMTYNGLDVTTLQNVSYNTFDMSTGGPFVYDHRASAISFNTPDGAYGALTDADFTNVVIQGNIINNLESYRRGIGFWNGGGSGGGIIAPLVKDNTITGTAGSIESYGIDFIATGSAPAATDATVVYNVISNTAYGIYLRTAGCAPGAEIHYNNIAGNIVGLDNTVGPSVDAQYNWWGDPTGPYNPTSNPSGTGNPVTDYVNYSQYLASPLIFGAHLYIDPTPVNKAPGDVGTSFTVAVTLSNFTNLMGFDINLTWNNSLITFVSADRTPLNSLWPGGWTPVFNQSGAGYYELAATSISAARNNTGASVLFNVTFQVVTSWKFPLSTPIHFDLVKLSDNTTPPNPIPAAATDGTYAMGAMVPGLEFKVEKWNKKTHAWDNVTTGPPYHFEWPDYFHVDVYVTNVGSLTGYNLTIDFTTEVVAFEGVEYWGIFGPGNVSYTPGASVVEVNGSGSAWSGSEGLLCKLTFYVNFTVSPDHIWKYGNPNNSTLPISIANATLGFGSLGVIPMSGITVPSALSIEVDFIRGDVDCNGVVSMADIGDVAGFYGKSASVRPEYDLNNDGIIDIYDIVTIATNFGYGMDP